MSSDALQHPEAFSDIVTESAACGRPSTIWKRSLTRGAGIDFRETGVGKELIAHAAHRLSKRPGELVAVNLADSTMSPFQIRCLVTKGAFTGANQERKGSSARRRVEHSFSMRLAIWNPPRRSNCYACYKRDSTTHSVQIPPSPWMSQSSLRPIAT
ncbi:sigma 54-interacting transcriptional regulator [Candidatus Reidiella endopervernicosa]|uniref:Sigma 54-interacting transcriptional regulator n=1 Tax=Candidatus Reidiella endopervernicosa TaxID=2738883 RepID=A0A6N0HYC3_9GAMM|nr:sigma 54-interacting transcriptional regulator [Candidatus Reidiella endopervernicosa]